MLDHQRKLLAAQGYADLGMIKEALAEIDSIEPHFQEDPSTLEMHMLILMRARRWEQAHAVSCEMVRLHPALPAGFIHAAFCLHELGRTSEARDLLLTGPDGISEEPTYHYNLACYDAVLGNQEEALRGLQRSFQVNKKFREFAKNDPDLRSLRELI